MMMFFNGRRLKVACFDDRVGNCQAKDAIGRQLYNEEKKKKKKKKTRGGSKCRSCRWAVKARRLDFLLVVVSSPGHRVAPRAQLVFFFFFFFFKIKFYQEQK